MLRDLRVPHVYLFSEHLLPRPSDWGPEISIAGFMFLEEETQKKKEKGKGKEMENEEEKKEEEEEEEKRSGYQGPEDLVHFIQNAERNENPILYIGFGSILLPDCEEKMKVIFGTVQRIKTLQVVLSNV